jgi:hypothetical protein
MLNDLFLQELAASYRFKVVTISADLAKRLPARGAAAI